MIEAIGFDLDNTLYEQRQHFDNFANAADAWLSEAAGVTQGCAREALLRMWEAHGPTYPALFDRALEQIELWTQVRVNVFVDIYHGEIGSLTLYPGIRNMLGRLAAYYPLFLITDGDSAMQRAKVTSLKIEQFFDSIVFTAEHGCRKPSPKPFTDVALKIGVLPNLALYVGDNPSCDVEAASIAGMHTARVLTGPFRDARAGNFQPTYTLEAASEVEKLIIYAV